ILRPQGRRDARHGRDQRLVRGAHQLLQSIADHRRRERRARVDMNFAEFANDADILGSAGEFEPLVFEPGTVGWDQGVHYDTEDGVTLVKVTLYRGRDPRRPLTRGEASGHQVL